MKKKRILMVALDFPPCKSAGVQRTLKFAEYLKDFGWEPLILTVNEGAHNTVDHSQTISPEIKHVYRSFAFNASRDFSIKGKYLSIMKVPDRWWTWKFTAVPLGKKIIKEFQPDVIWSTYPVSTTHNIAYKLSKWSGLPWVADYRDPLQSRYDNNAKNYDFVAHRIERKTLLNADKVVFTTKRASTLYQSLYPDIKLSNFHVIENGYDEGNFASLTQQQNERVGFFSLLHSGAVYENGRDPQAIFSAISTLKRKGKISNNNFELAFRGLPSAGPYESVLSELDITDLVAFKPSISYKDSLEEMMQASALLIIQGPLFNNQIPGKLFEYIRTNKPILALTPNNGATGLLLKDVEMSSMGIHSIDLEKALLELISLKVKEREGIEKYSRYEKTKQLANILNSMER